MAFFPIVRTFNEVYGIKGVFLVSNLCDPLVLNEIILDAVRIWLVSALVGEIRIGFQHLFFPFFPCELVLPRWFRCDFWWVSIDAFIECLVNCVAGDVPDGRPCVVKVWVGSELGNGGVEGDLLNSCVVVVGLKSAVFEFFN